MAPEQVGGNGADHRADIYSLGVVAYQMLTGRLPWDGPDAFGWLYNVATRPPPRPRELVPDLDPELESIVLRCIEIEPGERFQSVAEVRCRLEALQPRLEDQAEWERTDKLCTSGVDDEATVVAPTIDAAILTLEAGHPGPARAPHEVVTAADDDEPTRTQTTRMWRPGCSDESADDCFETLLAEVSRQQRWWLHLDHGSRATRRRAWRDRAIALALLLLVALVVGVVGLP
jgi:serine/threonine protein kinase